MTTRNAKHIAGPPTRLPCLAHHFENRKMSRNQYSSASSDRDTNSLPSAHHSLLPQLSGQPNAGGVSLQFPLLVVRSTRSVLQVVKEGYVQSVNIQSNLQANSPKRFSDTLSSYISKTVGKVKLQMKAHFSDPNSSILIFDFLMIFKFAFDTYRIHE